MGQLFCSACAGLTGKHKHRVFPSCCWQRPARLRKTCYHSCDADSVQESRRFWCFANFGQQRVNVFFFMWNENFGRIGEKLLPTKATPVTALNLSISHWSLSLWPVQGKGVCSDLNKKAQLLQMAARKCLGTMSDWLSLILNQSQPKVCSQIGCKWNSMFESHVVTSVDRTSFYFGFEVFLEICLCKHSSTVLLTSDQPSITWSWRSVMIFKFSVLAFWRLMTCSMCIQQKLCKVKIFQLQSMLNVIRCIDQSLHSRIFIFRVWPWYSIWKIQVQQSCTRKNLLQPAKYDESYTVFWALKKKLGGEWYKPMP